MDPGGGIRNDGNKLSWSVLRHYCHIWLEGLRDITKKQRIIGVLVEIRPASSQVEDICSNLSRPVSRNTTLGREDILIGSQNSMCTLQDIMHCGLKQTWMFVCQQYTVAAQFNQWTSTYST